MEVYLSWLYWNITWIILSGMALTCVSLIVSAVFSAIKPTLSDASLSTEDKIEEIGFALTALFS